MHLAICRFSRRFVLVITSMIGPTLGFLLSAPSSSAQTSSLNFQSPLQKDFLLLVVDKSKLVAELMTWPTDYQKSKKLFEFRVAIGKKQGDKFKQGDKKTPEGVYFAESIIDGANLPEKYGPNAVPINFPNPIDLIEGKTGYGIWLHGVEADQRIEAANVTDGCIAFYNYDIQSLTRLVKPQQTVVMITKDGQSVNQPTDLESVQRMTEEWYQSWEQRNLDKFISFYDESFRFKGKGLKAFKTYKKRVFGKYQSMNLSYSKVRTFVHEKYALSIMNQDFNGDNEYISSGRKLLYWKKSELGAWHIVFEGFQERPVLESEFSSSEFVELAKSSPSAKALGESNL